MNNENDGRRKLSALLEKLHSKTVSEEVEWQFTSIPDRYLLELPKTGVALREIEEPVRVGRERQELIEGYEITILNSENKEIESFKVFEHEDSSAYQFAKEIFQYASTGYTDASKAIDAVISDIESMGESPGFEPKEDLPF